MNVPVEWSVADPRVVFVDKSSGAISTISVGTTTVSATVGALRATAIVSVRPVDPAVAVTISPSGLSLIAGRDERLSARVYDSTGRTTRDSVAWSSADPSVATVGKADGIVTAISAGTTTVMAAVGELRATAIVSVVGVAGSFTFTRMTALGAGTFTSDALLFSVADRTMRPLPHPSEVGSVGAAAWSPDGTRLAIEGIHEIFEDHGQFSGYSSDLYLYDAAASAWRWLTTNGASTSPSWSPDGRRIAYVQPRALYEIGDIYIVDVTGGDPVRLTRTQGHYLAAQWSPDGTRLAFSAYVQAEQNYEVFVVNADGSGLTNVTRNSAHDVDPSWSPDGTRLAFASDRSSAPGKYQRDVFVVDVDGSNVARLTTRGGGQPAWSPDGRQIVFTSDRALQVMNADGSQLIRLTTPPSNSWDSSPAWRR